METSESKLGFARSHLVLSLPRPDRAASPQDCTSTGLWRNSHLRVPHDPAGALSPACASMGMDLCSLLGTAGFHVKLEHLLLFQQGCTRRGIPWGCSEKSVPCFPSHDLRGVCIQVSVSE